MIDEKSDYEKIRYIVDLHGLDYVLDSLAAICFENSLRNEYFGPWVKYARAINHIRNNCGLGNEPVSDLDFEEEEF